MRTVGTSAGRVRGSAATRAMSRVRSLPTVLGMRTLSRTFATAAVLCGAAWLTKSVVLAGNGGTESTAVGILWAAGMLSFLVAAGTGTALLLGRRVAVWLRVLAGVAAVPLAFVILDTLDIALKSVYEGDGWFRNELALVLAGTVMLALGARLIGSARRPAV